MKFQPNAAGCRSWLFSDGSQPFQLRVMAADEITHRAVHLHKTMHEYFYVIKGEMTLNVEGSDYRMSADDLMVVEPGERHCLTTNSDDLLLMLIMPPAVAGDKEVFS